jgi:hypothetical protein
MSSAGLSRLRLGSVIGATFLLLPASPSPQARKIRSDSSPSCRGCEIRVKRLVTLELPEVGYDGAGTRLQVTRDSRGQYYVTPVTERSVVIYDSTGREIGRLGREGRGPGEISFGPPYRCEVVGDSLFVFSPEPTVNVFNPNRQFVRTVLPRNPKGQPVTSEFRHLRAVRVWPNGEMTVCAPYGWPNRPSCYSLYSDGRIRKALGPPPIRRPRYRENPRTFLLNTMAAERPYAIGPDGHVWTLSPNRYVLEEWTEKGRTSSFTRDVSWYPEVTLDNLRDAVPAPHPTGLAVDDHSRLWVVLAAPKEHDDGRVSKDKADFLSRFDTVIEVLDARSGRVLATKRINGYPEGLSDGRYLLFQRVDENGTPFLDVHLLSFSENGG